LLLGRVCTWCINACVEVIFIRWSPVADFGENKFADLRYCVISVWGKRVTDVGARQTQGVHEVKQPSANSISDGLALIAESMIRRSMSSGSTRAWEPVSLGQARGVHSEIMLKQGDEVVI
jgi:hypothetical protein